MAGVGRLGRLLGVAILGALGGGCFVGDAAEGLPCEQDGDCGLGVSCAEDPALEVKCCGGSCLQSAPTGPGTSSSSSASASTEPTTLPETESSVDPPVCGDGMVDPGEQCDPGADEPGCGEDCRWLCGNEQLDPGEDCDDEEAGCGEDCRFSSLCGNDVLDPGEACDVRLTGSETCLDDCKTWIALDWDGGPAGSDFCVDESGEGVEGSWECTRWTGPEVSGPRGSGPYFVEGDPWSGARFPEAILRTRAIDFPDLQSEDSVEIDFVHELDFNSNPDGPVFVDYAELSIEPAAAEGAERFVPLGSVAPLSVAIGCESGSIGAACTDLSAVDYCDGKDLMRTAGRTSEEDPVEAIYSPTDADLTGLHRLRFVVRYDCLNFDTKNDPMPNAWIVHNLRVTVRKAETAE